MANIKKNAQGYGYRYTDLAAINDYIESIGETYYQEIERIDGDDYVVTVRQPVLNGANSQLEVVRIRGCRVVQASLSGKVNPAQEQGSGLTYARRYSLLMAYGLATEDDDGESLTAKVKPNETVYSKKPTVPLPNPLEEPFESKATELQILEARELLENSNYTPEAIDTRLKLVKTSQQANELIAKLKEQE